MEIWLVILFLLRKKFHAKQIFVLTGFMKLSPSSQLLVFFSWYSLYLSTNCLPFCQCFSENSLKKISASLSLPKCNHIRFGFYQQKGSSYKFIGQLLAFFCYFLYAVFLSVQSMPFQQCFSEFSLKTLLIYLNQSLSAEL